LWCTSFYDAIMKIFVIYIYSLLLLISPNEVWTQLMSCKIDDTLCYINQKYKAGYPLKIEKKWQSEELISQLNGLLIMDVDSDCIPEILCTGIGSESIDIFDLKTRKLKYKINTVFHGIYLFTVGDVDNDGKFEFFVISNYGLSGNFEDNRIFCYQLDGSVEWVSDEIFDLYNTPIVAHTTGLADFNQDGNVELYINNMIFNAETGVKLADGGSNGKGIVGIYLGRVSVGQLDGNPNDLELAAGYTIYKVNITNTSGILGNTMIPYNLRINNKLYDGNTAIADINNDSILDVVALSSESNGDGVLIGYYLNAGIPTLLSKVTIPIKINNVYSSIVIHQNESDKSNQIVFGTGNKYFEYTLDNSNQFVQKWQIPVNDNLTTSGMLLFDLNNDGVKEYIFRDMDSLKVYNIIAGLPIKIFSFGCHSFTGYETAMYGDIDQSGRSVLCIQCKDSFTDLYGHLTVFGSPDSLPGWAPARGIWNQYAYNPLQINDDGTIPQFQPNQATYQGGRYNNFNVQASLLDSNGMYRAKAAGLYGEIRCVDFDIDREDYTVTFDLYNKADASLDVDTGLVVSFYDGDPETTGKLLGTYKTINNINAGTDRTGLTYTINSPNLSKLFMVVNTSRSMSGALVDSNFVVLECDYSDNVFQTTDLPRIDKISKEICTGETYDFYGTSVSTSGVFYHEVSNVMGCDSIVARLNLAVKDVKNTQAAFTACDSASINGNTYLASDVLTFKTLTTNGCDSIHTVNLTINASSNTTLSLTTCDTARWENQIFTQTGIYPYIRTNASGCDSTITLDVVINNRASSSINVSRCTGQTYDFYGQLLTNSGTYSHTLQTINGCDSIVTLRLLVSNNIQTNQSHQFCAGDSIRIGSAWVKSAGPVVENLLSTYGCDSIVTHRIDVLPLYSATPNYMLCAGDSVRISGAWIKTSGIRIENLSSIYGCDSIITHNVFVRPAITSNISNQICAGDSIRFDNQWLKSSGTFTQTLAAANGCDSLLSMNLSILPTQQTQNTIMTCIGKPIKIHGIDRYTADTYSQTFTARNGCDSTSQVTLLISPYLSSSDLVRICAGDTTTINGTLITEAGQYIDTIVAANGCPEIVTTTVSLTAKSVASQAITLCPDTSIVINGQVIDKAGTYVFDLHSAAGCDSTLTTTVSQLAWPDPPKIEVDCEKEIYTATINTIDPWLHRWSDGDTSPQYTLTQGGKISVRAYTSIGCMRDYEYSLPLIPKLADIPKLNDKLTKGTETVAVKVDVDPAQWQIKWQPSSLVDCDTCFIANISTLTDTTISVTLRHSSDCSFTQTFRIVRDVRTTIDIPNIFRPTSSTGNDTWSLKLPQGYMTEASVYDRWGQQVYHSSATEPITWDGTYDGRPLVDGVYIYIIKLTDPHGKVSILKGDVTVLR
jgi:gliding motility-associated-like protein